MLISKTIQKGVCGVYKITCLSNGKAYIGSALDVWKRWIKHIVQLRNGTHPNAHLKNAFDLYGEINFKCEIIESCNPESLISREQYWIDELIVWDNTIGFNIRKQAHSNLGLKDSEQARKNKSDSCKKWASQEWNRKRVSEFMRARMSKPFSLRSPTGEIINGINLTKFCRENKLCQSNMRSVLIGKRITHRGWTLPIEREFIGRSKEYEVRSPSGELFSIKNASKFCRENGLQQANFISMIMGRRNHCGGWTLPNKKEDLCH